MKTLHVEVFWTWILICGMGSSFAHSQEVKIIHLSDEIVAPIRVSPSGTVLSFPMKPSKVILGKAGSFGIEYVENDLAISPLTHAARSHLFVYLFARRFSFDLSVSGEGSSVILVRDAEALPKSATGVTLRPTRPPVKPKPAAAAAAAVMKKRGTP